jgi:hypothetical protein
MTADDKATADGSRRPGAQPLKLRNLEDGYGPLLAAEEKLPGQDSNLDKGNQNPLCYRYTTG